MLLTLQDIGYHRWQRRCEVSIYLLHVSLIFHLFWSIQSWWTYRNPSIVLTHKREEDSTTNLVKDKLLMHPRASPTTHRDPCTTKQSSDTLSHAGCLSAISHSQLSTMHPSNLFSKCCMQRSKLHQKQWFRGMWRRFIRFLKSILEKNFRFVSK